MSSGKTGYIIPNPAVSKAVTIKTNIKVEL